MSLLITFILALKDKLKKEHSAKLEKEIQAGPTGRDRSASSCAADALDCRPVMTGRPVQFSLVQQQLPTGHDRSAWR